MAVIDWLAKNDVKEDYVLIIDADMIMRMPLTPEVRPPSLFSGAATGHHERLAAAHGLQGTRPHARLPLAAAGERSEARVGRLCLLWVHEGSQQRAGHETRAGGAAQERYPCRQAGLATTMAVWVWVEHQERPFVLRDGLR